MNAVLVWGLLGPALTFQVAPIRIGPTVPTHVGPVGVGATNLNSSLNPHGLTAPDLSSRLSSSLTAPNLNSGLPSSRSSSVVPADERSTDAVSPAAVIVPPPPGDIHEPPPDGGDDDDDEKEKPRRGIEITGTQFLVGLLIGVFVIGYWSGSRR